MKFIADEDIAQIIISFLQNKGHNVIDIKKKGRSSDKKIVKLAETQNRIIITHDKDFLTLLTNPQYSFKLIFIRVIPQTKENMINAIEVVIENIDFQKIKRLAIIEVLNGKVRVKID